MCLIPFMNPARQKPSFIQMEPKPADTEIHTASEDVHVAPQADRCRLASDGRDLAYIDIYLKG